MSQPQDTSEGQYGEAGGGVGTAVREGPTQPWPLPQGAGHAGGGGYGGWGYAGSWAPPPPSRSRHNPVREVAIGFLAVLLAAGTGVAGWALGRHVTSNTTSAQISSGSSGLGSQSNPGSQSGSGASGSQSTGGSQGSSGSGSSTPITNAAQIASQVDPGIVDINTQLSYEGASAAGTGMVLTSDGEVLTNNHVVEGATSISVTDVGNNHTYTATVLGTDSQDDVALLKLTGASGLTTVSLGNSANVQVGEGVVAIGNAGGSGGTPSYSAGAVGALDQSITASDELSSSSEQLSGLVETSATLQPGDSGGPLVNSSGQVVGMDTAASGGFQFQSGSSANYAVPIDQALSIAHEIQSGQASTTVHIGAAAFLGVEVEQSSSGSGGASVADVVPGSPAAQAGIAAGDTIDSVNGQTVDSPDTLSSIMEGHHPGDTVQVGFLDGSGQQQTVSVVLATGPAA